MSRSTAFFCWKAPKTPTKSFDNRSRLLKFLHMSFLRSSLITVLLSIATGAIAQTVNTDPVGFVTATANVGLTPLAVTLLNTDAIRTSATSVSGNAVTLSGQTNVGSLLTAGEPYYVEVYSGTLKGDRFDVDTAATITAANGTVVLDSASANNTFSVGSIGANLNNATVALRKHVTIEQLQSTASAALVGNNSASAADQVQFFSNTDNAFVTYFLRGDGTTWRKVGTTQVANKIPIPPGVGVFVSKKGTGVSFTMTGSVRNNDFAQPWKAGTQLVAPGYPIDTTPAGIGATATNGWVGNNNASSADQIQVFDPQANAFNAYYLRLDGTNWRKVGTTTVVNSSNVASASQSFFVKKASASADNVVVNPIQQ